MLVVGALTGVVAAVVSYLRGPVPAFDSGPGSAVPLKLPPLVPAPEPTTAPTVAPDPDAPPPSVVHTPMPEPVAAPSLAPDPDAPAPVAAPPAHEASDPVAERPAARIPGGSSESSPDTWIEAVPGEEPPSTHPVKAKLKSGIYHLPGMLNYDRTVPDRWYTGADTAEADQLRRAKR